MKRTALMLFLIVCLCSTMCSAAASSQIVGSVEIEFDFARMPTIASNQVAVWIEDQNGSHIKTLYVTDFTARRRGYEKRDMQYLETHPYVLSKYAKRECGFSKGYDTAVTRLQMQTYVLIPDFKYSITKEGVPYGWGNAVLEVADRWLGAEWMTVPDDRTPEQSFERMISHLKTMMPEANESLLQKELK